MFQFSFISWIQLQLKVQLREGKEEIRTPLLFPLLALTLVLGGCGESLEVLNTRFLDNPNRSPQNARIIELVKHDLESFPDFYGNDYEGRTSYSKEPNKHIHHERHRLHEDKTRERFIQIFGSNEGAAVRAYVEQRIQHVLTPDDFLSSSDSYCKTPTEVASNIGISRWRDSLIDRKDYPVFLVGHKVIPVESHRVGIIVVCPNYQLENQLPVANEPRRVHDWANLVNRQVTLIHEARHQDCVGGLTESQVERSRHARTPMERYQPLSCGQFHIPCPRGHNFEGIHACDPDPWGSYGISAVYYETALKHRPFTEVGDKHLWHTLLEQFIDSQSRLVNHDYQDGLLNSQSRPDMKSRGLRKSK